MPIPGLTDIYEFSDWLKRNYLGPNRKVISITPELGGLITVQLEPEFHGPSICELIEQSIQDSDGVMLTASKDAASGVWSVWETGKKPDADQFISVQMSCR